MTAHSEKEAAAPTFKRGSGHHPLTAFVDHGQAGTGEPVAMHGFDQNRIWCAVVQLACELLAWTQMLGFADHPARRWEPKRPRLRLFSIAGRLAHHARALVVHLAAGHRCSELLLTALTAITSHLARPG